MDLAFSDHRGFQLAALGAAAGAAAAGLLAWAVATRLQGVSREALLIGAALAGSFAAVATRHRASILASGAGVLAALGVSVGPRALLVATSAALLATALSARRRDAANASAERAPSRFAMGAAVALLIAVALAASLAAPALAIALSRVVPLPAAWSASAALVGLWCVAATAPLHLSLARDPLEAQLRGVTFALGGEARSLADRALEARAGALAALRTSPAAAAARADLPRVLDRLAERAVQLARRGAELARATAASVEHDLARRAASLAESAAQAADPSARASYQRAADAVQGQLEHCLRVRRARERVLARLHEEVAQLERAQFALSMLDGADAGRATTELDLLGDHLAQGAAAIEDFAELAETRVPA